MEAITTAVTNVVGLGEGILSSILANTTLMIIVGAGFAGLGIRVLRKVIGASKSIS